MECSQSISNSIHLLQRINNLFKSSELSDIKLIFSSEEGCPKTEFHLHKLILCSGSEVFRAMFGNELWRESKTSEVVLQEEAFLHPSLESFLSYFYSGQITLTYSTLLNVLILADKYQVTDLQEVCIDFMLRHMALPASPKPPPPHHPSTPNSSTSHKSSSHLTTINTSPSETTLGMNTDSPAKAPKPPVHNLACSWLQYSQLTNHQNLTNMCSNFILNNFNKVIKSADFFSLDVDWLTYFLNHSSLVISDEFILLQALVRWFMKDFDCPTSEDHFDHALSENKNSKSNSDLPPSPSTSYFFSSPTSTISQPPTSLLISSSSSSSASSYSVNHSPSEFCGGKVKRSKSNDDFDINDDLGGNNLNENFQKNKIRKEDNDSKNDIEISEKADETGRNVDDGCMGNEEADNDDDSIIIDKLLDSIRFPLMTTTQQKAIQTEVHQYLKKQTHTFLPTTTSSSFQPPPKTTSNQPLFSSSKSILSSFKSLTSSPLQFISSKMSNNKPICTAPTTSPHRPSYAIFDTNPIFHYTSQSRKKFEVLLNSILERIDKSLHLIQTLKSSDPHIEDVQSLLCSHGFSKESLQLRNYTNDIWSTSLNIDKFRSLAKYEMRSVVFSSPSHPLFPEESASHPAWDWSVELFAKGVIYHKCLMIGLWRNLEVMGDSYDMVRLAIHSEKHKSNHSSSSNLPSEVRRVVVSVLITGYQNDAEFIVDCIEQTFTFDSDLETKFINDLFPFSCLNNCKSTNNNNNESLYDSLDDLHGFTLINNINENQSNDNHEEANNPTTVHTHISKENKDYFTCSSLLGSTNTLKTTIIIKPLLAV